MVNVAKLKVLLAEGCAITIKRFMAENNLILKDGKITYASQETGKYEIGFLDRRQLTKKIQLNSLYGATLNQACRFYDKRFGQSVTLSGKVICNHLNSYVNECITGVYQIDGEAIIAADTDSSQFSAWTTLKPRIDSGELVFGRDEAVTLYSAIGDMVNESFPAFMAKAFNCPEYLGKIIKASCESVGSRGLYTRKKRYAILNYYKDGIRLDDKPKLKAMGLDLRRSDTPKICQVFLTETLLDFLNGKDVDFITNKVREFRDKFKHLPLHQQGTPKRVNKLTSYTYAIEENSKSTVPGHVRAAYNWNQLREANGDNTSIRILDGMKCIVVPLKANSMRMTSVAYPIDEPHLPQWFLELPMDSAAMVAALVDKKIENLFGDLDFYEKMIETTQANTTFDLFFS